jgi:hypothetical protein
LHYTLDGSVPTESSPTVASGNDVAVTQSSTLMVRGFNGPGWTPSDVKTGTFYIMVERVGELETLIEEHLGVVGVRGDGEMVLAESRKHRGDLSADVRGIRC